MKMMAVSCFIIFVKNFDIDVWKMECNGRKSHLLFTSSRRQTVFVNDVSIYQIHLHLEQNINQ